MPLPPTHTPAPVAAPPAPASSRILGVPLALTDYERTRLTQAYTFLRHVEHRLQMEHGLQTHSLPLAPEKLELQRRPNHHMAFGTGIHFCLGYQLARLEGKCALQALYARWPKLALAVAPEAIRWRSRPGLRAIVSLPVMASG